MKMISLRMTEKVSTRDQADLQTTETMMKATEIRDMMKDVRAIKARDARGTRDTILTPPTAAEWAAIYAKNAGKTDLGTVWDGLIKPVLDALDPDDREKTLKQIDRAYGKTRDSASATLADFKEGAAELNRTVNQQNKNFWDKRRDKRSA